MSEQRARVTRTMSTEDGGYDHQQHHQHQLLQQRSKNEVQDSEHLRQIITQWNANRLDLFELTLPNEVSPLHF